MTASLTVLRAGALTTVQDHGRAGHAHLAVPRSGALDRPAMDLANRLVGNPVGAAVLETTLDGVTLRLHRSAVVAVTGAHCPIRIDGTAAGWAVPLRIPAGARVDVGRAVRGLRSYLAVSGGIDVDPVLGSRSTDLLSGLGPAPLADGMTVPLGPAVPPPPAIDFAPYPALATHLDLTCWLGPREDRITPGSLHLLAGSTWTVSPQSNRIGLRLDGPALGWRTPEELPSEGVVGGGVQVPADGRPVLFLADHPVTGGYPVVGVVPRPDLWRCAQAAPGTTIRFRLRRLPLSP